jgi:hypothetical protein
MDYDLNAVIATFDPWDFALTIDGVRYQTVPITLLDLKRLGQIQQAKKPKAAAPGAAEAAEAAAEEAGYQFIEGLFVGGGKAGKPDVRKWDETMAGAVLAAIAGYVQARLEKNCRAVTTGVVTAARMNPSNRRKS